MDIETKLNSLVEGKKVFEIGGLGFYDEYIEMGLEGWRTPRLKEKAKDFVDIDIDQRHIEMANKNGLKYFFYGDIEDFSSIKAPDIKKGSYDVVLMIDVVEHLNNVGRAMKTMKELLAPGGIIAISTPNPWSFNNILNLFRKKEPSVLEDHTYYIVESNFKQILKRNGLKIKEIAYYTSDNKAHSLKQGLVKIAGKFNRLFNSHILVIAESNG